MKRNTKRLPALLLAIILCLNLLPATALAANFPSRFYAALMNLSGMGTVSSSGNYTSKNTEAEQVHGMEYAGGVVFTVVGKEDDDGWRELRMYNSSLTNSRTIGTVSERNYAIVDTAMDLSGAEPALYGTYNQAFDMGGSLMAFTSICSIDLTDGHTSNYLQVTGLSSTSDIIYAIAFDKEGTLYAIGADAGADGGPASLYTIDLENVQTGSYGSQTVAATKVDAIKTSSGSSISTNYCQDLAFDHATGTLYWAENAENVLYTVNTTDAVATKVGQVKSGGKVYPIQSFCIPYDTAFGQNDEYMVSVVCEGAGKVTSGSGNKPFYMVSSGEDITLNIVPNTSTSDDLKGVKVDGQSISTTGLVESGYTFTNVTGNHVIEVTFKKEIPATQKTVTWLHYQGEPAKFYTVDNVYKFYDLPFLDQDVPREGYTQTLLDENGAPIPDDEIILPGNYDVHVTHPGNAEYAALDVIYENALQLGKCPGTPGRPVVYGKVGCKQGDLSTTSALQDYYGADGTLIDAAYDEIPVTLVWQDPEITYNEVGNFYASATIYAADELDQRLKDCYTLDDGEPLEEGCLISFRSTQVVVLPADQASLIQLQTSDASGGTVSGQGVYKNDETVTVTATVNENGGYTFGGWQENGSVVSNDATYTFTASGDRTLTALFEVDEDYRVTLRTDPAGAGAVTGGGSYEEGDREATVTATANPGYYFMGWYKGDNLESADAEYTFTVEQEGVTLTARFGVDYLAKAEQAQENFDGALDNNTLKWATLKDAVDAYEAAADFVENPPSVIENAATRYDALTAYYNDVEKLDLSGQNIDSADLEKLNFFTSLTDLDLSGNKGLTSLSGLSGLNALKTLDISNTGVTNLGSDQSVPQNLTTLTARGLKLTSISALADIVKADDFAANNVTLWDFTGSTLPGTEANKSDVETIQTVLAAKFDPPAIQTTPEEPEQPGGDDEPTTPVIPPASDEDDEEDSYSVSVPAGFSIRGGAITVSPRSAEKGDTITIAVKPDDGYELDTLTVTDNRGREMELTGKSGGRYTFEMPASPVNVKVTFRLIQTAPVSPFTDVSTSAYYYDAVLWAVENGVTNGTTATAFSPDVTVTRAQMVTFLWRAHGAPRADGANPFTDVSSNAYYYDAVLWAVERGITNGTTATTFSPNAPVTRAQAVTFQWRTAGSPAMSGGSFGDVAADAYYAGAVSWAVANGITNGTTATTFSPNTPVSRAQAVTFLYRELA